MKVIIVEERLQEAKKLTRILRLIDPGIAVQGIVKEGKQLTQWLQTAQHPDIVLINQDYLPDYGSHQQQVHAKVVVRSGQDHISYIALRTHTILQWQAAQQIQPHAVANRLIGLETARSGTVPAQDSQAQPGYKKRFFVEQGQKFLSLSVTEIAYFFSDGRFVYCSTFQKNKYVVQHRIEELEQLLDPELFYRVNRSFVVSVQSIEQISSYFGGRYKLKLVPPVSEDVLVSRKRVQGFKKWLGA